MPWMMAACAVAAIAVKSAAQGHYKPDPFYVDRDRMRRLAEEQASNQRSALYGTGLLLLLVASVIYTVCEFAGLVP